MNTTVNQEQQTLKGSVEHFIKLVEEQHFTSIAKSIEIKVGSILKIGYKVQEGSKERIQIYEGLIIGVQNRGLNKTATLRRKVQGIGLEQTFFINSPKISFITEIQKSKTRRAKLFFTRSLSPKAIRVKLKRVE